MYLNLFATLTNLANLGANAILGVSMAVCRAGAAQKVHFVRQFNF